MDIKTLLDQPSKLPTVPKVTQKLIQSFSDEDVSIDEIAGQLAADPALTAKLLRLANSAYFHVSRTIGTVDDALRMLGFVMVRNLVLGNGMVAAFGNTPGLDMKQFWRYNLYTACAARWLARQGHGNGDLAFTLGLMHAIGQLQMHAVAAAEMAPLDTRMNVLAGGRAALEKAELGFHHGDVSAELAWLWNFPKPMIEALRDVPQPLAAAEFSDSAAWVHLGAWRARIEVLSIEADHADAAYPAAVAERLGLDPEWANGVFGACTDGCEAVMPALKLLTEGLDAMLE